jgi:DNA repair protein RadD
MALNVIIRAIPNKIAILIQAATGAGKTIIFCKLIEMLLTRWPQIRIGILAHRRELISQAYSKLINVWPAAPIGIACASTGMRVDTDRPVVIGSVQTLARRVEETAAFDLIIVDEAHRIPPINKESLYQSWLSTMRNYNPKVRILGFTATPFRLGHGFIFGTACKSDHQNLFDSLDFRIGIRQLQKEGYLCDYRAKEAENIQSELKSVGVSGDFNLGDLSDLMSKKVHVGSAVHAVIRYALDRRHIVVFCVTIDHARKVKRAFRNAGFTAAAVHSKMPLPQRDMILHEFDSGRLRVLCNVGVLTEGWDSPAVDCVLLCRPTRSAALYVQMIGRGLRPHPDKTDVLILDLSNNCSVHGDPDKPIVPIPGRKGGSINPVVKVCPNCLELVMSGNRVCPSCGYEWPQEAKEQNGTVDMRNVSWSKPEPFEVAIENVSIEDFTSKKGNRMIKMPMVCRVGKSLTTVKVHEFFDFEGNASDWSRGKARRLWSTLVGTAPPESVEEAMARQGELLMSLPDHIEVIEKGKLLNVRRWQVMPPTEKVTLNG